MPTRTGIDSDPDSDSDSDPDSDNDRTDRQPLVHVPVLVLAASSCTCTASLCTCTFLGRARGRPKRSMAKLDRTDRQPLPGGATRRSGDLFGYPPIRLPHPAPATFRCDPTHGFWTASHYELPTLHVSSALPVPLPEGHPLENISHPPSKSDQKGPCSQVESEIEIARMAD